MKCNLLSILTLRQISCSFTYHQLEAQRTVNEAQWHLHDVEDTAEQGLADRSDDLLPQLSKSRHRTSDIFKIFIVIIIFIFISGSSSSSSSWRATVCQLAWQRSDRHGRVCCRADRQSGQMSGTPVTQSTGD